MLLPHTDYGGGTMEIERNRLHRAKIEATYVTGLRDVKPLMLLFGCRTTGTAGDPAGFAARFMQKGACAVFHSSTDLRNVHATELARRLTGHLTGPRRRPRLLSDALTAFRREAVHDGMIVAFAISAFGDADWRVAPFQIEMLPAQRGDALWLTYGEPPKLRHVLVDGGPSETITTLVPEIERRVRAFPAARVSWSSFAISHIDPKFACRRPNE